MSGKALIDWDNYNSGKFGGSKNSYGKKRFCGLENAGATCYMNSLLQTLFMTPEFRKIIFDFRWDEKRDGPKEECIPYQLQVLFGKMAIYPEENYVSSFSTSALRKSFGWEERDAFHQEDIQELNRLLFDAIERATISKEEAPAAVESTANELHDLYCSNIHSSIHCLNCEKDSGHVEDAYDFQIPLRDNLIRSLAGFITAETLTGENKYACSTCSPSLGKQDAHKGSVFSTKNPNKMNDPLPLSPILTFQLQRFNMDWQRMVPVKDNSYESFPLWINMNDFVDRMLVESTASGLQSDRGEGMVGIHSGTELTIESLDSFVERVETSYKAVDSEEPDATKASRPRAGDLQALIDIPEETRWIFNLPSKKGTSAADYLMTKAESIGEIKQFHTSTGPDNEKILYSLFSVCVHSGGSGGGHYFAFIRDCDSGIDFNGTYDELMRAKKSDVLNSVEFYEFNDSNVSPISLYDVYRTFGTKLSTNSEHGSRYEGYGYSSGYGTTAYLLYYRKIEFKDRSRMAVDVSQIVPMESSILNDNRAIVEKPISQYPPTSSLPKELYNEIQAEIQAKREVFQREKERKEMLLKEREDAAKKVEKIKKLQKDNVFLTIVTNIYENPEYCNDDKLVSLKNNTLKFNTARYLKKNSKTLQTEAEAKGSPFIAAYDYIYRGGKESLKKEKGPAASEPGLFVKIMNWEISKVLYQNNFVDCSFIKANAIQHMLKTTEGNECPYFIKDGCSKNALFDIWRVAKMIESERDKSLDDLTYMEKRTKILPSMFTEKISFSVTDRFVNLDETENQISEEVDSVIPLSFSSIVSTQISLYDLLDKLVKHALRDKRIDTHGFHLRIGVIGESRDIRKEDSTYVTSLCPSSEIQNDTGSYSEINAQEESLREFINFEFKKKIGLKADEEIPKVPTCNVYYPMIYEREEMKIYDKYKTDKAPTKPKGSYTGEPRVTILPSTKITFIDLSLDNLDNIPSHYRYTTLSGMIEKYSAILKPRPTKQNRSGYNVLNEEEENIEIPHIKLLFYLVKLDPCEEISILDDFVRFPGAVSISAMQGTNAVDAECNYSTSSTPLNSLSDSQDFLSSSESDPEVKKVIESKKLTALKHEENDRDCQMRLEAEKYLKLRVREKLLKIKSRISNYVQRDEHGKVIISEVSNNLNNFIQYKTDSGSKLMISKFNYNTKMELVFIKFELNCLLDVYNNYVGLNDMKIAEESLIQIKDLAEKLKCRFPNIETSGAKSPESLNQKIFEFNVVGNSDINGEVNEPTILITIAVPIPIIMPRTTHGRSYIYDSNGLDNFVSTDTVRLCIQESFDVDGVFEEIFKIMDIKDNSVRFEAMKTVKASVSAESIRLFLVSSGAVTEKYPFVIECRDASRETPIIESDEEKEMYKVGTRLFNKFVVLVHKENDLESSPTLVPLPSRFFTDTMSFQDVVSGSSKSLDSINRKKNKEERCGRDYSDIDWIACLRLKENGPTDKVTVTKLDLNTPFVTNYDKVLIQRLNNRMEICKEVFVKPDDTPAKIRDYNFDRYSDSSSEEFMEPSSLDDEVYDSLSYRGLPKKKTQQEIIQMTDLSPNRLDEIIDQNLAFSKGHCINNFIKGLTASARRPTILVQIFPSKPKTYSISICFDKSNIDESSLVVPTLNSLETKQSRKLYALLYRCFELEHKNCYRTQMSEQNGPSFTYYSILKYYLENKIVTVSPVTPYLSGIVNLCNDGVPCLIEDQSDSKFDSDDNEEERGYGPYGGYDVSRSRRKSVKSVIRSVGVFNTEMYDFYFVKNPTEEEECESAERRISCSESTLPGILFESFASWLLKVVLDKYEIIKKLAANTPGGAKLISECKKDVIIIVRNIDHISDVMTTLCIKKDELSALINDPSNNEGESTDMSKGIFYCLLCADTYGLGNFIFPAKIPCIIRRLVRNIFNQEKRLSGSAEIEQTEMSSNELVGAYLQHNIQTRASVLMSVRESAVKAGAKQELLDYITGLAELHLRLAKYYQSNRDTTLVHAKVIFKGTMDNPNQYKIDSPDKPRVYADVSSDKLLREIPMLNSVLLDVESFGKFLNNESKFNCDILPTYVHIASNPIYKDHSFEEETQKLRRRIKAREDYLSYGGTKPSLTKNEKTDIIRKYFSSSNSHDLDTPRSRVTSEEYVIVKAESLQMHNYLIDPVDDTFEQAVEPGKKFTNELCIRSKEDKPSTEGKSHQRKKEFSPYLTFSLDINDITDTLENIKRNCVDEATGVLRESCFSKLCSEAFTTEFFAQMHGIPIYVDKNITASNFVTIMKNILGVESNANTIECLYMGEWKSGAVPVIKDIGVKSDKKLSSLRLKNKSGFKTDLKIGFMFLTKKYVAESGEVVSEFEHYDTLFNEYKIARSNSGMSYGYYYDSYKPREYYPSKTTKTSTYSFFGTGYGSRSGAMRITTHAERMKEKEIASQVQTDAPVVETPCDIPPETTASATPTQEEAAKSQENHN